MAADLQHALGAHALRLLGPEAGVEEAGIVDAELAHRGVDGGHLGGLQHRDLDRLLRRQDVEFAGIEQQFAVPRDQRLPVVARVVAVDMVHVDDAGVAARAEARHPVGEIDPDALGQQLGRAAALEAQLVQPGAGADQDGKGLGRDLDIGGAVIALAHVVEGRLVVRQQPHEDVDPAGGALRIGPRRDAGRQVQALLQLGDIDAALFQDRALGEIQLVHGHVGDAAGHRAAQPGQEARANPPAAGGQAQVEAGGLHLISVEGRRRSDGALSDQVIDGLAGENPRARRVGHRRDTRREGAGWQVRRVGRLHWRQPRHPGRPPGRSGTQGWRARPWVPALRYAAAG